MTDHERHEAMNWRPLTEYLGPFHFRCTECGRVHFMERDAISCHSPILGPPTPIRWTASNDQEG